jgi:uncharacterized integral membrane protein
MHRFNVIVIACLAGLVVLFVLQNLATLEITFLFWTFQASRALMITVSVVVGLIIGTIAGYTLKSHQRRDRGPPG